MGCLTVRRRRLTACGGQPVGLIQHTFDWFDLDGAVAPTTGARFVLGRPYLNADTFPRFGGAFAQACPDSCNILLFDTSGAHTAQRIRWPAHVQPVWLPPSCPELNPSERVWRDVKAALAWPHFVALEAPQVYVGHLLQAYDAPTLQALTGYA